LFVKIAVPLLALTLAGCASNVPPLATVERTADWRAMATNADRARLRGWRDAWTAALAQVRAAGKSAQLTGDNVLFDPDRALAGATPPPGDYRCRVYKLGAKGTAMAEFTAYPAFTCRITREGDISSLAKLTGSQRPVGLILADRDTRAIFLGTLVLGDETSPLQYGQDAARDMAGLIERVGDARWRLVLPYPAFESILDVIELTPQR
jgi:hypothetical protein